MALRDKSETVLLKIDKLISNSSSTISKNNILLNAEPFKNPIDAKEFIEKVINEHNLKGIYIDDFRALSWLYDFFDEGTEDYFKNRLFSFDTYDNNLLMFFTYLSLAAIENDIPIVLTEEMTRENLNRGGHMRIEHFLSDIKSEYLEVVADKILLLYRHSYYRITEDEDGNSTENVMRVIIAKNKNGESDKELILNMNHNQSYN